jgi:alpha-L-fucosidase 2
MSRIAKLIAIAGVLFLPAHSSLIAWTQATPSREVLWYTTPAALWDHALPIGNGRLGAMVFGGANAGTNNGDVQASQKNAALDGRFADVRRG